MKMLLIRKLLTAISFVPGLLIARDATTMIRIPSVALEVQIVLGEGKMTRETMILESESILDRDKDTAFIKIQFAESHAMLMTMSMPTGLLEREIWASMKRRWNGMSLRYGELISIKGNAVLRIRDGVEIQTIVVRGKNPLLESYDGRKVEFVYFGMLYNFSNTAISIVDASAVVPKGELDVDLAKRVVEATRRALDLAVRVNVTMREDRFWVFTPRFGHSLFFDLDAPPGHEEWSKTPGAECLTNQFGRGFCAVHPAPTDGKQKIEF